MSARSIGSFILSNIKIPRFRVSQGDALGTVSISIEEQIYCEKDSITIPFKIMCDRWVNLDSCRLHQINYLVAGFLQELVQVRALVLRDDGIWHYDSDKFCGESKAYGANAVFHIIPLETRYYKNYDSELEFIGENDFQYAE